MDKIQQAPNPSRGQHDTSSQVSQEELQTSSLDVLDAGTSTQFTPKQLMVLQRTLGNHATIQVVNRKTLKTTLPSGFAQRTSLIQRDDDDSGDSAPVQEQESQEQEEEVEDPQSDSEVAEQDAELNTIPPEAAEVEAIANVAKGGDESEQPSSEQQNTTVTEPSPDDPFQQVVKTTQGAAPAPNAIVNDDDDYDSDTNSSVDANDNSGVQAQSAQTKPITKIKGKNKGNHHYAPNRLGVGLVGAALQGGAATSKAAGLGVDATTATYLLKEGGWIKSSTPSSMESANDNSGSEVIDKMTSVGEFLNAPPLNIILPIPTLLQRVYGAFMKYKHFKAFKELAEASGGVDKASLKQKGSSNTKLSTYGYLKTKRGFWTRFAKAVMTLGQIIARVVTVASGLTSSIATEGADLALAIAQGMMKLTESIKGLVKIIFGKRGKHRALVANAIVDKALGGNQDMLTFLVSSEALSKTWFAQLNASTKSGIANWLSGFGIQISSLSLLDQTTLTTRPQDTQQMFEYLKTCQRLGLLQKLSAEVATVMKST